MKAAVQQKREVAPGIYEISFKPEKGKLKYAAGQYISVSIPDMKLDDPRGNRRDFSLSSTPADPFLTITFRVSESGFKRSLLNGNNPKVVIEGPFGQFSLPEKNETGDVVMIAGGIGITPFRSMTRQALGYDLSNKYTLVYVIGKNEEAAYLDEFLDLEKKHKNLVVKPIIGHLTKSKLVDAVKDIDLREDYFCVAGPPGMVLDTREMLVSIGANPDKIKSEEFNGYSTSSRAMRGLTKIESEMSDRSKLDLEALLQALSTTAVVSETDASGTISYVNNKFIELSKYTREELIGQNHRILKSGEHPQAFYKNLWNTISRGKLWRGLLKNRAKDGTYYWVDTSIAPIMGPDGKPAKYISVRFPVTERQEAEEKLVERARQQSVLTMLSQEALANQDLPTLLNSAVNLLSRTLNLDYCGVFKLAEDGQTLQLETSIGFKNTKKENTTITAGAETMAGYTLRSKEPVVIEDLSIETRFVGADILHDNRVVSGISSIIHGADKPYGILEVFTNKKRLFKAEDVSFVQAVAYLLANAARNQLDKRKVDFLGIASHELKTPLASMKTFTQLLAVHAKKEKDDHASLLVSKIENRINRLNELIRDLLDVSRINAGKIEYNEEKFTIGELLEEVVGEQQLLSKSHKISFKNHLKQKVYGDKYRIAQVISNLITNAIKYSPGEEEIKIVAKHLPGKVVISVTDYGIGIPKAEQVQIFEKFFQGNRAKTGDFPGGLGLGLYICGEIVKHHKGDIWVESKEGKGSTFSFSLPIV